MSSAEENIINTLVQSMQGENKPEAYDTGATITRIENGVAWVHIPGGVDETPVKLTIAAEVGDEVQVRVSGGQAFLVGNATAPPTDDKVANKAVAEASEAAEAAEVAVKTAEAAAKIAGDTNQYFWHTEEGTDTGAHITEMPREDFLADPDNGGGNLLARSNGIALRDGLTELATLQQSGMDVNSYDSQGNYVNIAHLGYGEGVDSEGSTTYAPFYTFGTRKSNSRIGNYSHAEGLNVTASAAATHAEGFDTEASDLSAHAEGYETIAAGLYSHAQNVGTVASFDAQTAIGRYNDQTDYTLALMIGNGTADNARSNAMTVDWSGNVEAAGDITDGSGNTLSAIATLLSGAIMVRSLQIISASTTIAAGGNTGDTTVTPAAISGYTPILATPRNTGGNGMLNFYKLYMDSSHNVVFSLANPRTSSVTFSAAYVNVLYVKNELVG